MWGLRVSNPERRAARPRTGVSVLHVTRLLDPTPPPSTDLRYGSHPAASSHRPVVVWTVTRSCNLACRHCYSASINRPYPAELTDEEVFAFLDDLAAMPASRLLMSGGEPLLRPRACDFARYVSDAGVPVTLSTNGTFLADPATADAVAEAGFSYVGISFDGVGAVHDDFRGEQGAFGAALAGLRSLRARGVRVGARMTLTRTATPFLDDVLDLVDRETIDRVCFYHLVPSGRGRAATAEALDAPTTRWAVERIFAFADRLRVERPEAEVLTVANAADGPYLVQWMAARGRDTAGVRERLARTGGNRSGAAVAHVSNTGDVHPDQFSWGQRVGSIRQRPFSDIWADDSGLLGRLRDRHSALSGRCGRCGWLPMCGGNLRARAQAVGAGLWAADPGCYLTDAEIEVAV